MTKIQGGVYENHRTFATETNQITLTKQTKT